MQTRYIDMEAAVKRLREWVQAMDLDDLALAISELDEFEGDQIVVRWEGYCDSEPYVNGKPTIKRKRKGK